MKLLIISNCTAKKQSTGTIKINEKEILESGLKSINKRTLKDISEAVPAVEIYKGPQHKALMEGIRACEGLELDIDLRIVSTGYGIIPADRRILNYTCSLYHKSKKEKIKIGQQLNLPQTFKKLLTSKDYDCGVVLLGKDFLTACDAFKDWSPAFPTLILTNKSDYKEIKLINNLYAYIANYETPQQYNKDNSTNAAIKGEIAKEFLIISSQKPEIIEQIFKGKDLYDTIKENTQPHNT